MKVSLVSDVHLEFSFWNPINPDNADVLVLSGDIMVGQDLHDHPDIDDNQPLGKRQRRAKEYRLFLKECSDKFPHIIYIAGNHEFYQGKWPLGIDYLREECNKFSNIYFLENENKVIDDITFIGATLWTNANKGDPVTIEILKEGMNDYRVIRNSDLSFTKLTPYHTIAHHRKSLDYIASVVRTDPNKKYVVCGHHAPSYESIHEKYRNTHHMNGGYASDLSEFILDYPQIKLWTHGHVHDVFDYMIGETRIVCNPRGYVGFERGDEIDDPFYPITIEV